MSEQSNIEFSKNLERHDTNIPGLIWFDIPTHGDNRGWFKENWQRQKMTSLGLPDFGPIQNNISFNATAGTTRGIHAEPWDKYVSVATGRVFGAWTDLREGGTFGQTFTLEIDPTKAIFVPRGVGNAFQALEDNTAYTYLVNDHWSADNKNYAFLNLADPTAKIDWPIPLDSAELSEKDKKHPYLQAVQPIKPRSILVTGANGQLARALKAEFPDAHYVDRNEFDISDQSIHLQYDWRQYQAIINTAAYTNVDGAETSTGRVESWQTNAEAVKNLAKVAIENNLTLVHISSDYVFDGTTTLHNEDEPFSPLNVYGQTKAAGDIVAATVKNHYIIRTSWVIGEGKNFVNTMRELAKKEVKPSVINDQIGRLTFTNHLARSIKHLLATKQPAGTYNVTNDGQPASWADVAKKVFELSGHQPDDVTGISSDDYYKDKPHAAPRPKESTLNLQKIKATGLSISDWQEALQEYVRQTDTEGAA